MTLPRWVVFGGGVLTGTLASALASRCPLFQDKDERRGKEILKYGAPNSGPAERYYENHVLHYDQARKIPIWVAEHLTAENLKGKASRRKAKFKPDPLIDADFSATNADYWDSGWSRGHMTPAGDNKTGQTAMNESFYLSNILPQDIKNNGGFWNRFEIYCRDLTKKFENVRVISGPVMMPEKSEEGQTFMKYPVIGKSEVAVPTHLYKVIVVEDKSGKDTALASFIVPNIPISFNHSLKEYQVPLESLEKKTGLRMVPKLEKSNAKDLCKVDACELMNKNEFDLYILEKRLWAANNMQKLNKVWGILTEKNLEPTQHMKETYEKKLTQFKADEKKNAEE